MSIRVVIGAPRAARITGPVTITAVLAAAVLLVVSHIYVTIPLVPAVAAEYDTTLTAAAWIGAGFGFAFAAGNLVFPTLSDHVDPRAVMAFGLVAVAATGIAAGAAPDLRFLIAARAVQGFLAPALAPVALAYLPRVLPERLRPTALGVLSSCFLLAGIVGQAWSLAVTPTLGWRWALWAPVPFLIVIAYVVSTLPSVPRSATPSSIAGVLGMLASMLRRRRILVAYTGALTILLTFVGMYVALQAYSTELGATGPAAGLLLRLPGLPGIVLGWFAGAFIARWGVPRTGTAAFTVAAAGLGLEAAGGALWLTLAGSAVFVAGLAVAVPTAVTLVGAASGPARGAGLAGYAFLIAAGASIAPLLVDALSGTGFAATCAILAVILLVPAIAFASAARETVTPGPSGD